MQTQMQAQLSHDVPAELAAQYPDLLLDPIDHARLVREKYKDVFGFSIPDRVEQMRTDEWNGVDLLDVLAPETYMYVRDIVRIETISAEFAGCLLNRIPFKGVREHIHWRPLVSPEGWDEEGGTIVENKPDDRVYLNVVFNEGFKQESGEAATLPDITYTVQWRSGAVTLLPLDLVKVHRYTSLPLPPPSVDLSMQKNVVERWRRRRRDHDLDCARPLAHGDREGGEGINAPPPEIPDGGVLAARAGETL